MVEIKRDHEIEYENNAGKLRQLRNENLINDGNYRTVNCFFEHRLNEKICFVREIEVRDCLSRSEEQKQQVINRIKALDGAEQTKQSLMDYLERINGKLKTSSVRSGNIKYYFIHCVPVLSRIPPQI